VKDDSPPPALLAMEGALVAIVVLLSLWLWTHGALVGGAAEGGDTAARFEALWAQGRGRPVAALMALVVVGSLAACGLALRRAVALGRVGLREAWRAAAFEPRLTIGHFLLAFGVVQVAQAPALALLPGARLEVDGAPVDAPHVREVAGGKLVFSPSLGAVRLTVPAAVTTAVTIDGRAAAPGVHRLAVGQQVECGSVVRVLVAPTATAWLGALTVAQALSLAALLVTVRALGGWSSVGLTREGLGAEVRRGALAMLAFLPVYALGVAAWVALGKALGAPVAGHALIEALEREGATVAPLIIIQASLLAPISEEVLYRGLLAPAAARVAGPAAGVLLSAVVFAAQHPGWAFLLPMTLLGSLFAALYATSPRRSLAGSIVAHMMFNTVTLVVAVGVQVS
jgi:membrane protease YdiL (CAAX protease family)